MAREAQSLREALKEEKRKEQLRSRGHNYRKFREWCNSIKVDGKRYKLNKNSLDFNSNEKVWKEYKEGEKKLVVDTFITTAVMAAFVFGMIHFLGPMVIMGFGGSFFFWILLLYVAWLITDIRSARRVENKQIERRREMVNKGILTKLI